MPRTSHRGRKKETLEPLEEYLRLDHHKQLLCWNYFRFTETQGKEGWNPVEAGSVYHYRSSAYIQSLGSASWFRHLGKQMVTLAEKFAQQQQIPPRPTGAHTKNTSSTDPLELPDLLTVNRPPAAPTPTPPALRKHTNMYTPSTPPRTPLTPGRNRLELGGPTSHSVVVSQSEEEYPSLPYPVTFGYYTSFDYTSRKKVGRVLVRMLAHSAVELQDIEYEWITPRVLKLRVAWPEWFQFAEQMALFVTDNDTGLPMFPPEHPLTEDMASNNMMLQDEVTKRIWDEGFIKFDRDMKEDEFLIERLNIKIESKGISVKGIQFCAEYVVGLWDSMMVRLVSFQA